MASRDHDPLDPLHSSNAALIDRVCDQFEQSLRAGQAALIEDYLQPLPNPLQAAALRELLSIELDLLQGRGNQPDADDYRRRFPDHLTIVHEVLGRKCQSATVVESD